MPDGYEKIGSRADSQALAWAYHLTEVLGHNRRYDTFELYRRTDWYDNRSAVLPNGAIVLGAQTANWIGMSGSRMYDGQIEGQYRPTRQEAADVRQALDDFITVYLDKVDPPDPAMAPGLRALDSGLRDTVVVPKIIEESRIDGAFPQIRDVDGRQPYLYGTTRAFVERLGNHLGMPAGDLEDVLVKTPPAQRFEALADALVENDPLQRRLPDGSVRTPPEDHVARLKAALTQELGETFERWGEPSRQHDADAQRHGRQGATTLLGHCAKARDAIDTDQPGYQQVASLMSVVQTDLGTGRASAAQGRDSEALVLQLKLKADYWNGALHTSDLPDGALGLAGTDRSLTFDQERVVDVLAAADPTRPPSPELRDAVDVVATEATRLCNPVAPGTGSNNPAGQAFEDRLCQDFVGRQQTRMFAALGYSEAQLDSRSPDATATAQVVATLTEAAARKQGLEPHEVTARLLTTPSNERIEAAAALSLGEPGTIVDRDRWTEATKTLAGTIEATITKAADADSNGQTKLHAWNRATAGERLSHQLTVAIDKAGRPVAGASSDEALLRSVAAATSGQPRPGGDRTSGSDSAARRGHQPDNGKSGQRITGRD
ncbi:hypothetical protein [Kribbella kalugense]|uniref:Uncharacterized protein n=1 Tax=Kribbella kalugense TaxID=2512221 RepID=A0A4R7ZKT2_9ACTN|nr:hypothetical protein [Kribbella kalugense]TDW17078.1 hypothetical protein EV650_3639 [Kribbella kalugense]